MCKGTRAEGAGFRARTGWREREKVCASGTHCVYLADPVGTFTHLGPRQGNVRPRAVQGRDRNPSVLRRSTQSLAAWHEREYQWTATPILSQRQGSWLLERRELGSGS